MINDKIDLIYQGTSTLGNGAVGPRDYVILRNKSKIDPYFMSTGSSVDFTVIPSRKNFVR